MEVATTPSSVFESNDIPSVIASTDGSVSSSAAPGKDALFFELGLWLSGLESFLNIRTHSFVDESRSRAASRDWAKEFRLTYSTLLVCSRLTFQLGKTLRNESAGRDDDALDVIGDLADVNREFEISADEIYSLSVALKDAILLNEGLLRAAPFKFGEWTAWSNSLAERLGSVPTIAKLIRRAEKTGEEFLPDAFKDLLGRSDLTFAMETDLRLVLPYFGRILKWLSVIETMLEGDEPLKPALLIFSRIYEQIQELTTFINHRLLRFADEEDELFGQLDGAAYTASIELKKVYSHELAGITDIRSTPSVYARVETAYALLNDSFQLTVINFARLIDPSVDPNTLFPEVARKLKRSIALRRDLWSILQALKSAESDPENYPIDVLRDQLGDFYQTSLHYLFYKDRETVERFIEEVLVTTGKKDLVPILHRFGAYIETLFGQVNMRIVLADHPFQY